MFIVYSYNHSHDGNHVSSVRNFQKIILHMCIQKSMHKNDLTLMDSRDQDNSMLHEGIKCRPRLCQTFNMDSATTSNRFNVVSVEALTVKDFSESRRASKAFNRFGNRTRINKKCHDGEPCNQSIDCIAWPNLWIWPCELSSRIVRSSPDSMDRSWWPTPWRKKGELLGNSRTKVIKAGMSAFTFSL